jgi:hypothetical protein
MAVDRSADKLPLPDTGPDTIRGAKHKGTFMRKVSISQAWDETRVVLARDGKLIASVALALLVLPGLVVNVLLPEASGLGTPQAVLWTIVIIFGFLVTFAGQLSIVRLATGPHITVGDAIKHSALRVLPFIGAFLLWTVPLVLLASVPFQLIRRDPTHPPAVASLGLLAIGLLGIFLAVRFLLAGPVASSEPGGPVAILKRSWNLSAGNWWRLFGFLLIFFVGALVLIWATTAVIGVVARLTIGEISRGSVAALIVVLIAQCVTAAVYAVLFVMEARMYVELAGRDDAHASVPRSGT